MIECELKNISNQKYVIKENRGKGGRESIGGSEKEENQVMRSKTDFLIPVSLQPNVVDQ